MNRTRILSIDGGGIKGIVPAVVLLHLEKILQHLSNNQTQEFMIILIYFQALVLAP